MPLKIYFYMELIQFIISLKECSSYKEEDMKKIIIMICLVLAAVSITACTKNNAPDRGDGNDTLDMPIETVTFSGTIIELNESSAIVEPFEGESIRGSADKISINLEGYGEFTVGDEVVVEYDGTVMESYPAQVNVLGITKAE